MNSLLLSNFNKQVPDSIRSRLRKVIVFGSQARGDAQSDSDLDVAVIVDKKDPGIERQLENAAYQAMYDNNFATILSLKIFSEEGFNDCLKRGFSFYRHIVEEGVAV